MAHTPKANKTLVISAAVLLTTLFAFETRLAAQDQPKVVPTAEEKTKSDASAAAKAAAKPDPTPEPDIWEQEELTGDWGGTRSRLKEKGVELEFKMTHFFQGTVHGGVRRDSEYTGKFQTKTKFDLGKLAGWKFWSVEIETDTRFGGPPLTGVGALNPVNTAAIMPTSSGTAFSISALNFTRLFPIDLKKGDLIAVSFGRFDLLSLTDEDFFAGDGTSRFMNMSQIGPLTVLRQVPLVTNGASFAYVRHGEPFFTFALLDTNDHSTDPGLSDLFADGVTFSPAINLPTKWGGKTGKHSFGFAITTKKYTPFDFIRQIVIPGPPVNPITPTRGSWSINYTGRQYIVERGPRDGWGVYTQISFADEGTSPVTTFAIVGLGGNGLFKSRPRDEFGLAYSFTDLSQDLKDNLNILPLGGVPRPEHGVEMFYNFYITPWLRLTNDLQIIRPTRQIAKTAIVPGVRLELVF